MLELNIKVLVHSNAEKNIIGIKEEIAYKLEGVADVLMINVKDASPLQMRFNDGYTHICEKVTYEKALDELKKANLSLEELQNIVAALIEESKTKPIFTQK